MKVALSLINVALVSAGDSSNPIAKILTTLSECEAKVTKEGEEAQKVYAKVAEWCGDSSQNLMLEIKTGQLQADGLSANVFKETSNQQALTSQIDDLAGDIAADEKDVAAATKVRHQENTDFKASEADLEAVIDTIGRAIAVIERNQATGASMMQMKGVNSLTDALKVMVQATSMSTADAKMLTAFVQNRNGEDDEAFGAPAAAVYEHSGGGIVDLLEGLKDQANEELDKSRAAERTALFNYEKLKQSLEDSVKYANSDLAEAKKSLAASQEGQATAEGDFDVTKKALAEDQKALAELHQDCMSKADSFETEAKSRAAEMHGIKIGKDAMKSIQLRGNYAFLQTNLAENPAAKRAVQVIRNAARKHNDPVLSQVASRMASTVAMGSKFGEDVFAKIKEQIVDSIAKLQDEQAGDATQKAYCDKELAESKEKVAINSAKIEKHTTKIEQKSSASLRVKAEVDTTSEELAKLMKEKAEADALRQKEKSDYEFNEAETAQSLSEIKFALKTLRDFYGQYVKEHTGFSSQDGTAQGVIAMLETVEAEYAKSLAQLTAVEDVAVREYDQYVKEFDMEKVVKDKAIKYKTKEYKGLDKYAADETTDRDGVQNEFDANSAALSKLQEMCVGKAETYEERKARREDEIAELKEGLDSLESDIAASAEAEAVPEAEAAPEAAAEAAPPAAAEAATEAATEAAAEAAPVAAAEAAQEAVQAAPEATPEVQVEAAAEAAHEAAVEEAPKAAAEAAAEAVPEAAPEAAEAAATAAAEAAPASFVQRFHRSFRGVLSA